MRNDWQDQDEQPKTRADYRREQERAEQDFQERDRKRVEVEKEYARTHGRSMLMIISASVRRNKSNNVWDDD